MASDSQPESTNVGWLHSNRVVRGIALVCAVATLSGAVTYTANQSTRPARPPLPSETSEIMTFSPPLEQALWMRRAALNPIRSPSPTGHIRIPAIGVDSSLVPRGLSPDSTLDVPQDWGVTGWFEGGPFPGDPGPAVVVGHVDSTSGPAVFYRLRELRRGDVIVVWRKGGLRSSFRVESLKWFPKSSFPTKLVYGAVAAPALRLITCGGAFDQGTGHYVDNLVVFASPMKDS
jgi:Sortase domain